MYTDGQAQNRGASEQPPTTTTTNAPLAVESANSSSSDLSASTSTNDIFNFASNLGPYAFLRNFPNSALTAALRAASHLPPTSSSFGDRRTGAGTNGSSASTRLAQHLNYPTQYEPQHQHHHHQQAQQQQQQHSDPSDFLGSNNAARSSQFRSKTVCTLNCKHCTTMLCARGMKAILLADMNVELYSTDCPPFSVQLVNDDYTTRECYCRIRDVACLGCGNIVGYHVTQPCSDCLDACNNGHFWMFHVEEVDSIDRMNAAGTKTLLWHQIPRPDKDQGLIKNNGETVCR